MADDVQLTDLAVIQRYSLAVRGATASRAELVAALQADLAWLQGATPKRPRKAAAAAAEATAGEPATAADTAPPADAVAADTAPAKKATKSTTKRKA